MAYQDRWVRGAAPVTGDRDCAGRYEAIRSVVEPYNRQITVWDLGANLGYFGSRLANDFGAVSVMVEPRTDLIGICQANQLPTTIVLTHRLSVQDLRELAVSECPDLVLALNVLHHFEDWRGALYNVLDLGCDLIIETPGLGDTGTANYETSQKILRLLEDLSPQLILESPSHVTQGVKRPMYLIKCNKMAVTRGYAYGERVRTRGAHPVRPHEILSSRSVKSISYTDGETRPWVPGMNLWNWLQMGGSYPSRPTVQRAVVKATRDIKDHGDLRPWNMILQGHSVKVIDAGHRKSVDDAKGLTDTIAWIANPELAYVR